MLDALLDHFDITVVCLEGQFRARQDASIVERLAGRYAVPYSRAAYFGFSLALYREADRRIQAWRPDVILADLDKAGMYAALLGRKHKYRSCTARTMWNTFDSWIWPQAIDCGCCSFHGSGFVNA